MPLKYFFYFSFVITLSSSCAIFKSKKVEDSGILNSIYLFQNGKEMLVDQIIEIEKDTFSLRFFNKKYNEKTNTFYAVQLAAFTDKNQLSKVQVGMPISEIPFFMPGTGMAPAIGGYDALVFNNEGCQYLFYENSENKRIALLQVSGQLLKLEIEYFVLRYNDKEENISSTTLNEFYIAILQDKNLNGKVDKYELHKFTIRMK